MPRTVTIADDSVVLELEVSQLGLLDRALSGYATALQTARDNGVISHLTFCGKADRVRKVQYMVWAVQQRLEESQRQPETPQQPQDLAADGGDIAAEA